MMKKLLSTMILFIVPVLVLAQDNTDTLFNIESITDGIRLEGRALSPDGTKVAAGSRDGLCIIDLAAESMNCTPYPEDTRLSTADYFAWSPDSTQIALTEQFLEYLYEPDIWLYTLEAQTFIKMTEDNVTDVMAERQTALIDFFPVWNPGDGLLYFIRSQESALRGSLMSVERLNTDGIVEQVTVLPPDFLRGINITGHPVFSPDGTEIALPIYGFGQLEEQQGIHVIDIESGLLEQIPLTMPFPGVFKESFLQEDPLRPVELVWSRDDAFLLMANTGDFRTFLFYEVTRDGHITPLFDLSNVTEDALEETIEPITGLPYSRILPYFAIVSANGERLYFSPIPGTDDGIVLSMALPPDETTLRVEAQQPLDLIGGIEDLLKQATSDGRGLLWGAYVIETGE